MDDKALVIVALRADHSQDVQRRLIVPDDLQHLAHFMGERTIERLNVGRS